MTLPPSRHYWHIGGAIAHCSTSRWSRPKLPLNMRRWESNKRERENERMKEREEMDRGKIERERERERERSSSLPHPPTHSFPLLPFLFPFPSLLPCFLPSPFFPLSLYSLPSPRPSPVPSSPSLFLGTTGAVGAVCKGTVCRCRSRHAAACGGSYGTIEGRRNREGRRRNREGERRERRKAEIERCILRKFILHHAI